MVGRRGEAPVDRIWPLWAIDVAIRIVFALSNPRATIEVYDPFTFQAYRLRVTLSGTMTGCSSTASI